MVVRNKNSKAMRLSVLFLASFVLGAGWIWAYGLLQAADAENHMLRQKLQSYADIANAAQKKIDTAEAAYDTEIARAQAKIDKLETELLRYAGISDDLVPPVYLQRPKENETLSNFAARYQTPISVLIALNSQLRTLSDGAVLDPMGEYWVLVPEA
jgi:hypothetical protein